MRHKATEAVYAYYQQLKGSRLAPFRHEIEPARLKSTLPDLFILNLDDDGVFRFRLAGTRVCIVLGQELRGLSLSSIIEPRAVHRLELAAGALLANKNPILSTVLATDDSGHKIGFELLMLPLYSQDGICDRILGNLVSMEPASSIDQRRRLLDIGSMEFITGDPSPAPDLNTTSGQVGALMSRSMQLRVYSGGKSK